MSTPSTKQKDYLLLLFNETGFTHTSRNAWLSFRLKRTINDLDDLTLSEASTTINYLKGIRENQRGPRTRQF
jgi:hypothetical protein